MFSGVYLRIADVLKFRYVGIYLRIFAVFLRQRIKTTRMAAAIITTAAVVAATIMTAEFDAPLLSLCPTLILVPCEGVSA